jgi:Relaxase/Mobilisation nuclease domain
MIGKVFEGGVSFREACKYVSEDLERAVVLKTEGVRQRDYKQMAEDFELQHQLRPEKEKPVFHAVLSFPAGEKPEDNKLVQLAQEFLEGTGITNTQSAIIKHVDTSHVHVHVLANRVSNSGQLIGGGMNIERGIKVAQELTRKHNLQHEEKKNLELTNREAMNPVDVKRYRLYEAIRDELPVCQQLEDLEKRLLARGITTRYRLDPASGARVGISFRIENHAFKGSRVDKEFSIRGLERQLAQQRLLAQEQKPEQERKLTEEQRPEIVEEIQRGQRLRMRM